MMKRTAFLLLVLAIAIPASAATYTWQGGAGAWGDNNWDVDGTPNQANPGTTVTGHDLIISDTGVGQISRGGQLVWSTGSSLVMMGGTFAINSNSTTKSALNTINGAMVDLSGSSILNLTVNGTNRCVGADGGYWTLSDSAQVTVDTIFDLKATSANSTLTLTGTSGVTVGGKFGLYNNTAVSMAVGTTFEADVIKFETSAAANAMFTMAGGTVVLNNANPLQTPSLGTGNSPSNRVNFTGTAGSVNATATSDGGTNFTDKTAFFALDGVLNSNYGTRHHGKVITRLTDWDDTGSAGTGDAGTVASDGIVETLVFSVATVDTYSYIDADGDDWWGGAGWSLNGGATGSLNPDLALATGNTIKVVINEGTWLQRSSGFTLKGGNLLEISNAGSAFVTKNSTANITAEDATITVTSGGTLKTQSGGEIKATSEWGTISFTDATSTGNGVQSLTGGTITYATSTGTHGFLEVDGDSTFDIGTGNVFTLAGKANSIRNSTGGVFNFTGTSSRITGADNTVAEFNAEIAAGNFAIDGTAVTSSDTVVAGRKVVARDINAVTTLYLQRTNDWTGGNGNWDTPGSWSATEAPITTATMDAWDVSIANGSTVTVPTGALDVTNGSDLSLSGDSRLEVSGSGMTITDGTVSLASASMNIQFVTMNDGSLLSLDDGASVEFRGAGSPINLNGNGFIDFIGDATIVLLNNDDASYIQGRIIAGGGIRINGTQLATWDEAVDGMQFNIDTTGGQTELSLVAIPEPATMSLLALGGIAMLRRRKK